MLKDLFSEEPYKFQMRFAHGTVEDFYRPTPDNMRLISERRHILEQSPDLHVAALPQAHDILEETSDLIGFGQKLPSAALDRCIALGQSYEPDFLILRPYNDHIPKLVAGCACFPSAWDLREKIGRSMEDIHGTVPGLNSAIGKQINGFLTKLKPGISWNRLNWGLTRSPALNQHPSRATPALDETVEENEVYLRVEHQSLACLPRSKGVLFGIRVTVHPLCEIKADMEASNGLSNNLKTMPEEMARYKGISPARRRILKLLEG